MPKFRKKPVVIEAEQWFPGKEIAGVVMKQPIIGGRGHGAIAGPTQPYIETLEGDMAVSPGDWVITGVAGEKYPCKDSIFQATYEPAED
jgi:hypothetical protein